MAFVFSITLGISIVGLILILTLKRIELRTGRVLFRGLRPAMGNFLGGILSFVEHVLPAAGRRVGRNIVHATQRGVKFVMLRGALVFERTLEMLLHRVREKTRPPRGRTEVSGFLKEVAEHKRSLLEQPESKRTIFDE